LTQRVSQTRKEEGGPGRELFKDDIYECIHMIFKGHTIENVTNHIQNNIIKNGKKIRTVLNKMDDPDRECLKAKEEAKKKEETSNANITKYEGRTNRIYPDRGEKLDIKNNNPMQTALSKFPIIKKYTGTERTSFFNKHYENLPSNHINQSGRVSELMLNEQYTIYQPSNIDINDDNNTPYGIKSFELNVKPTHYGECGQCWLCNEPVYYYHGTLETTSCGDCEHVAGIVVGMLTGLLAYQGKDLMVYGYQPSHVHCNRFKNDDITIKFNARDREWIPDKESIKKIVEYIANNDAVYSSEYCPMLKARFNDAIIPETERTIYDNFENDGQYKEEVVSNYKDKCTTSIMKHSRALCNAINNHYDLNTENSQRMNKWADTIASFFKKNPSLGEISGGMDSGYQKKRFKTEHYPSYTTPTRVKFQGSITTPGNLLEAGPGSSLFQETNEDIIAATQQLHRAIRIAAAATQNLQKATAAAAATQQLQQAAEQLHQATQQLQYQLQRAEYQLQRAEYQLQRAEYQLQQAAEAEQQQQLRQLKYHLQQQMQQAAEQLHQAEYQLQQADYQLQQAAAAEAAYHHQRQLAGHTLNLLNAAVMLLYIHPELSFMECMRQAGIKLREPAKGKQGMDEAHEYNDEEGSTQKEDFSQNSATGLTADFNDTQTSPENYNTRQYYENYKMLVNEFKIKVEDAKNATGDKDDGDGGDDPIPDCVPVLYIYDPSQELSGYIKTPEYTNDDIKIEYPTKDSGKKGNNNDESNYCFDHIAKCILCKRHQDKIKNGDTQLHIYVPKINKRTTSTGTTSTGTTSTGTTSTGTYGGMLKRPKQRKTRKHNTKKKKRTIRKNKQHTKRSKRTFKKKSHKKSTKSQ
jgi:hypothetical protein